MAAQIEQKQSNDGGKVRAKKQSTAVDMTPLADLGFLLITFFMFTTTFSKPNVMGLNMPPKTPPDVKEIRTEVKTKNTLTLILGADNKLYWHQEELIDLTANKLNVTDYSREGIRKTILTAKQNAPEKEFFTVIIKPTDDATYENLVNTLDEMEITESGKYGIVDITPQEVTVYEEKSGTSSNP